MDCSTEKRVVWRKIANALVLPRGAFGKTGSGQLLVSVDLLSIQDATLMFKGLGEPGVVTKARGKSIETTWQCEDEKIVAKVPASPLPHPHTRTD